MTKPLMNPLVKKDLKVTSRSMKFSWSLFAYLGFLAIIFLLTMMSLSQSARYRTGANNAYVYKNYLSFFPVIGIAQLILIGIIIPVMTAASISGERERKTLDVLLTTSISPLSIVLGKTASAVIRVMIFVFASIPLMAIAFIVGGLSWLTLFEYIFLAFIFACFAGAIGVFCSSVCKKTVTAIILSYVIYAGFYGVLYVPALMVGLSGTGDRSILGILLLQLFNPLHNFIVFFVDKLWAISLGEAVVATRQGSFLEWIYSTNVWITISCIFQIGIAALFVLFSVMRIKPGEK